MDIFLLFKANCLAKFERRRCDGSEPSPRWTKKAGVNISQTFTCNLFGNSKIVVRKIWVNTSKYPKYLLYITLNDKKNGKTGMYD